jgi:hypothetical protein
MAKGCKGVWNRSLEKRRQRRATDSFDRKRQARGVLWRGILNVENDHHLSSKGSLRRVWKRLSVVGAIGDVLDISNLLVVVVVVTLHKSANHSPSS